MNKNISKIFLSIIILLSCIVVFGMTSFDLGPPTIKKNTDNLWDKVILYVPNRLLDLGDIVDISLGFGPIIKANVWITRYCAYGAGIGGSAQIGKWYNRQYGTRLESTWNASFMMLTAENTEITNSLSEVQKYYLYNIGIPSLKDNVYNLRTGPRDIFSIGIQAAAFIELNVEIHPLEILDFICGIFFIDLKGDDINLTDFN